MKYGDGFSCGESHAIILLIIGGSKRTQKQDIKKAIEYWIEFRECTYD
jgi:putative component of toxin-antitoxin plasmid stabilization module